MSIDLDNPLLLIATSLSPADTESLGNVTFTPYQQDGTEIDAVISAASNVSSVTVTQGDTSYTFDEITASTGYLKLGYESTQQGGSTEGVGGRTGGTSGSASPATNATNYVEFSYDGTFYLLSWGGEVSFESKNPPSCIVLDNPADQTNISYFGEIVDGPFNVYQYNDATTLRECEVTVAVDGTNRTFTFAVGTSGTPGYEELVIGAGEEDGEIVLNSIVANYGFEDYVLTEEQNVYGLEFPMGLNTTPSFWYVADSTTAGNADWRPLVKSADATTIEQLDAIVTAIQNGETVTVDVTQGQDGWRFDSCTYSSGDLNLNDSINGNSLFIWYDKGVSTGTYVIDDEMCPLDKDIPQDTLVVLWDWAVNTDPNYLITTLADNTDVCLLQSENQNAIYECVFTKTVGEGDATLYFTIGDDPDDPSYQRLEIYCVLDDADYVVSSCTAIAGFSDIQINE